MNRKEIETLLNELRDIVSYFNDVIKQNPFYSYHPTVGKIGTEEKEFLLRYLTEEEIPETIDGGLDVHLSTAELVCISGSNQSGKSVTAALENIIQGTHLIPNSLKHVYPKSKLKDKGASSVFRVVAVDDKQLFNTVIPSYRKWCPSEVLKNGNFDHSFTTRSKEGQKVLKLGNWKDDELYCTIEFMTNKMDVKSFQGPMRVKITYDEQPLEIIHYENLARLSASPHGIDCLFAFTATEGITWATDLFSNENLEKGKIERYQLTALNNPVINWDNLSSIYDRIQDKDIIKIRLLGMFVSLFGNIYQGIFKPNIHVIEPFEINSDDFVVVRGIDPHMAKDSCAVEVALDRENNQYVVGCLKKKCDVEIFKQELDKRAKERNYRLGWSICDMSADSDIPMLHNKNIYKELKKSPNHIPSLFKSGKSEGSIHVGVDAIKKLLRGVDSPKLFIFKLPENMELIKSFKTIERGKGLKEEVRGMKDTIEEGKHDFHACLRYIQQRQVRWYPKPEFVEQQGSNLYI